MGGASGGGARRGRPCGNRLVERPGRGARGRCHRGEARARVVAGSRGRGRGWSPGLTPVDGRRPGSIAGRAVGLLARGPGGRRGAAAARLGSRQHVVDPAAAPAPGARNHACRRSGRGRALAADPARLRAGHCRARRVGGASWRCSSHAGSARGRVRDGLGRAGLGGVLAGVTSLLAGPTLGTLAPWVALAVAAGAALAGSEAAAAEPGGRGATEPAPPPAAAIGELSPGAGAFARLQRAGSMRRSRCCSCCRSTSPTCSTTARGGPRTGWPPT